MIHVQRVQNRPARDLGVDDADIDSAGQSRRAERGIGPPAGVRRAADLGPGDQ